MLAIMKNRRTVFLVAAFLSVAILILFAWWRIFPVTVKIRMITNQTGHILQSDYNKIRAVTLKTLPHVHSYIIPFTQHNGLSLLSLPVFVTGFDSSHFVEGLGLVEMFQVTLERQFQLVVYDLGLSEQQRQFLKLHCNCTFREFNFDAYPSHIRNLKNYAFKAVILQEALSEFGYVLWLDTSARPVGSHVSPRYVTALSRSIPHHISFAVWSNRRMMRCFTHDKLFEYFNEKSAEFVTQKSVAGGAIAMYKNKWTYDNVFLPWLVCSLYEPCIAPAGAYQAPCDFQYEFKPVGHCCHRFDQSVITLILSRLFHFNQDAYLNPNSFVDFSWFDTSGLTYFQHLNPPIDEVNTASH